MTEEYGNIADGFFLSQSEIDELRKSKRKITSYAQKKLQELMKKEQLRLTEDDLGDLLWLVLNYGDKLEKYPEENQVANLTTKLEKMLDGMG
jgi:NTP pyrophosphatase (non-canonical NTP hydrolase)